MYMHTCEDPCMGRLTPSVGRPTVLHVVVVVGVVRSQDACMHWQIDLLKRDQLQLNLYMYA